MKIVVGIPQKQANRWHPSSLRRATKSKKSSLEKSKISSFFFRNFVYFLPKNSYSEPFLPKISQPFLPSFLHVGEPILAAGVNFGTFARSWLQV